MVGELELYLREHGWEDVASRPMPAPPLPAPPKPRPRTLRAAHLSVGELLKAAAEEANVDIEDLPYRARATSLRMGVSARDRLRPVDAHTAAGCSSALHPTPPTEPARAGADVRSGSPRTAAAAAAHNSPLMRRLGAPSEHSRTQSHHHQRSLPDNAPPLSVSFAPSNSADPSSEGASEPCQIRNMSAVS